MYTFYAVGVKLICLHACMYILGMFVESARIRDLIATLPLPVHTGTLEWKLKHLYESCMEVDNVDADGIRPLQRIITELGKYSFLVKLSHIAITMKNQCSFPCGNILIPGNRKMIRLRTNINNPKLTNLFSYILILKYKTIRRNHVIKLNVIIRIFKSFP